MMMKQRPTPAIGNPRAAAVELSVLDGPTSALETPLEDSEQSTSIQL